MQILSDYILTLILFTPVLAALVIFTLPRDQKGLIRWTAFILSLLPLTLALILWFEFDSSKPGFQFQEQAVWYEAIGSSYHVGVDGISLGQPKQNETISIREVINWDESIALVNSKLVVFIQNEMNDNIYFAGSYSIPQATVIRFEPVVESKIARDADILIIFSEAVSSIDGSEITDPTGLISLTQNNTEETPVEFVAEINDSKTIITVNPTADLILDQKYSFSRIYF